MRLGNYKSRTGKWCNSTDWFFMCRVTQISSTAEHKSAAVPPALIQAGSRKGENAAHLSTSCDANSGFLGKFEHGKVTD